MHLKLFLCYWAWLKVFIFIGHSAMESVPDPLMYFYSFPCWYIKRRTAWFDIQYHWKTYQTRHKFQQDLGHLQMSVSVRLFAMEKFPDPLMYFCSFPCWCISRRIRWFDIQYYWKTHQPGHKFLRHWPMGYPYFHILCCNCNFYRRYVIWLTYSKKNIPFKVI